MTVDNVFDYAAPIWSRFSEPRHAGVIAPGAGVLVAQAGSPAAKSLLRLTVRMLRGQVAEARFQAYGCPSAIAVGEWLAQELVGTVPDRWAGISAAQIRQALEIPDDRAHCALMGEDVIRVLQQQVQA